MSLEGCYLNVLLGIKTEKDADKYEGKNPWPVSLGSRKILRAFKILTGMSMDSGCRIWGDEAGFWYFLHPQIEG